MGDVLVYGLPPGFKGLKEVGLRGHTPKSPSAIGSAAKRTAPKELPALVKLNSVPCDGAAPLFLIPGIHMYAAQ